MFRHLVLGVMILVAATTASAQNCVECHKEIGMVPAVIG
jgi:hypothetical protein